MKKILLLTSSIIALAACSESGSHRSAAVGTSAPGFDIDLHAEVKQPSTASSEDTAWLVSNLKALAQKLPAFAAIWPEAGTTTYYLNGNPTSPEKIKSLFSFGKH